MRAIKKEDLAVINYYQVPKWLMELFIKKAISQGAFKTYVLMYDRVRLSAANGWIDENGDVYIKYSYDEMQKDLCCSRQSISDNLKDLVKCELIDKKKCFSSSTIFYLNVSSLENLTSKEKLDCQSSRKLDYSSLENLDANKNNIIKNNTNKNNKIDNAPSSEGSINQDKVKFKEGYLKYIDLVSKVTGKHTEQIKQVISPSLLKDTNVEELLRNISESNYLQGLVENKPKINHFSTKTALNRILIGFYANEKDTKSDKVVKPKLKEYTKEEEQEYESEF